jgi:hypothetical protein
MQQHPGADAHRDHGEAKGATAMTEAPTDDQPCFVAEEPEHGHDGCWII